MLRGLKQNIVHSRRPHRDWVRPAFECFSVSCGGMDQLQGQGLWVQQTWVWHKPHLEEVAINLTIEPPDLHRTGETDSWRAQTKPCAQQDLGERSSDPTRDWPRLACECPGGVSLQQDRGIECGSVSMGPFEGGHHYLHYLHHSLVSGQTTGREHSPVHQEKIGLNIYWAWPCPSEQDPVPSTVSLSNQKASIILLSVSLRGQTEWKPQSHKANQTDHMGRSLV